MSAHDDDSKPADRPSARQQAPDAQAGTHKQMQDERGYHDERGYDAGGAPVTHGVYRGDEPSATKDASVRDSDNVKSGDASDYPPAHHSFSRGPAGSDAELEKDKQAADE